MPHAFTRFLFGELPSEPCWYVQREEELFGFAPETVAPLGFGIGAPHHAVHFLFCRK